MSEGRPRIGLIDYGMGNRRSVQKALEHVGAEVELTGSADRLAGCDGLVLPGVGAFGAAMRNLTELELVEPIRAAAEAGRPLLGICLGMQLLLDASEELGSHRGLGLLPGTVTRLRVGNPPAVRVPHIGWSEVAFTRPAPLTAGLPPSGAAFYHVHSYAARLADPADVVGTTDYGERFATIIARGSVMGTQFHPEKSSVHGLTMLGAFLAVCERARSTPAIRA